jgi:hypothetical protein
MTHAVFFLIDRSQAFWISASGFSRNAAAAGMTQA